MRSPQSKKQLNGGSKDAQRCPYTKGFVKP